MYSDVLIRSLESHARMVMHVQLIGLSLSG